MSRGNPAMVYNNYAKKRKAAVVSTLPINVDGYIGSSAQQRS